MESAIILFFSETLTNLVGVNDLHGKVFQIKRVFQAKPLHTAFYSDTRGASLQICYLIFLDNFCSP